VVHTLLFTDQSGGYVRGDYRLIVDGQGEILINGGHQGTYQAPTDQIIALEGQIGIRINRSEAEDPVRNIRLIHPDHAGSYEPSGTNTEFTDDFLAFVEDFDLIRFMDWTGTNNSTEELWANRVPADQYTMFGRVAWEQVIELANTAQKDPWICVPHRADDLYVRELARLFRENLDPELTLYLEYSNEVWNAIFEQNAYAAEAAAARGFTGEPWVRSWTWTALRSAEIFTIFEQEFGGSNRLLKILPTQSGNPWLGGEHLRLMADPEVNPSGIQADALAIAPYFGGGVAQGLIDQGMVNSVSLGEIAERTRTAMEETFGHIQEYKALAEENGVGLIAYEAGQQLVGVGEAVNNQTLTDKLIALNRHTGMPVCGISMKTT
jgi:hypothetical protein